MDIWPDIAQAIDTKQGKKLDKGSESQRNRKIGERDQLVGDKFVDTVKLERFSRNILL